MDKDTWTTPPLNINLRVYKEYSVVLARVVESLKKEGFVVLTEIDIQETLKRKLNVDSLPFKVMRIYHPQITTSALAAVPDVALLPYGVTVALMEDGGVEISVTDPLPQLTILENPGLMPFVSEAYARLRFLAEWWQKIR